MKNQFVILLKGINVGGNNMLKMSELKSVLLKEQFEDVTTIIQSGNIILSTDLSIEETHQKFQALIEKKFNLSVPVLVLTPDKIKLALDAFPFFDKSDDESKLHITFMNTKLSEHEWNEKLSNISLKETYKLQDDILYIYPSEGYHKAKLNATFLANKFKVNATNRNIKTIRKILAKTSF
jgi:uncharacterized protein (DUF1697 family)